MRGEIDVFSFGADGQAGGSANDADIGNWGISPPASTPHRHCPATPALLPRRPCPQRRRPAGFTLLELLVVMVIAGIVISLVAVNASPNERGRVLDDGQRIARLFELAQEDAQLGARPLAWEGDRPAGVSWNPPAGLGADARRCLRARPLAAGTGRRR